MTMRTATLVGLAIGVVYVLSPLTVWFAVAIVPAIGFWAVRRLDPDEQRWVTWMLVCAVAARVIFVVALFLLTSHSQAPFGAFFGDEEYFIKRSLWLRNLALGLPMNGDDLVNAFEAYSASSYLYLLALLQILVGPAPYGLHLVGIGFYIGAAVLLYHLAREAFGRPAALVGLMVLLFLPSLFAWSVSVLKEPLFMLFSALSVVMAVKIVRGRSWSSRVWALMAVAAIVAVLESIRQGGAVLSGLGVVIGLIVAWVARRPRRLLVALVIVPILIGVIARRPDVQFKAYTAIQSAARQHWGYVATEGYVYHLLDDRFYPDRAQISDLQFSDTMRFLVRAGAAYVAVPLPWQVQSRAALAYLPEQIVWYVLVALLPFGFVSALRRDALVTGLFLGHALVAAVTVALTSGNIGTLVRHRGLAIPYLVWLSAVGGCELLSRHHAVDAIMKADPTCL